MRKVVFLVLALFCLFMIPEHAVAQKFNKGNPGYVIYKDGTQKQGLLRIHTTNEKTGIESLRYQEKEGDKDQKIKVSELQEFLLNGITYYRMKIKVSLLTSKELMCPAAYLGKKVALVFNPADYSDGSIASTMDLRKHSDSEISFSDDNFSNHEFHLTNNGQYFKITRLTYSNDMKRAFGDNPEWLKKVESDPKWLKFGNIIENVAYYDRLTN